MTMPELEEWETLDQPPETDLEEWETLDQPPGNDQLSDEEEDEAYLGTFAKKPAVIPDIDTTEFNLGHPDPYHAKNGRTVKQIRMRMRKRVALKVFAKTSSLKQSAEAAGLKSSNMIHVWKKNDSEFKRVWDLIDEHAGDVLEGHLIKRAVEGVTKDVWYKGEIVGQEVQYSDRLLLAAVKSRNEKYRDNVTIDASTNVNVGIALIPTAARSAEEWQQQAHIIQTNQKTIDITPNKDMVVDIPMGKVTSEKSLERT